MDAMLIAQIDGVLNAMRSAITTKRCVCIPRAKNIKTLASLGILWPDALDEIEQLTKDDYFQGPSPDRDFPGSPPLWVFKKVIRDKMIYIKFKVDVDSAGKMVLLSFHLDNMP